MDLVIWEIIRRQYFPEFSHNRKFGELFVQGMDYGELAEGVATVKGIAVFGVRSIMWNFLFVKRFMTLFMRKNDPEQVLSDLFLRSIKIGVLIFS